MFIHQMSRRVLRWRFQYMARIWLQLMARFGASRDCWLDDNGLMLGTWMKYTALCGPTWAAGRAFVAKTSLMASGKWNSLHDINFIPYVFRILRANDSVRGQTGMFLSNLNFSYFILLFEVIFPQTEIAAPHETLLSMQYILLQTPR